MRKQLAAVKKRNVRGSTTGRPIMVLLDLLGRRWTLRIVWELRDQPLTSRALRTACDEASPTVLSARLSDLRQAGLVELEPASGYRLTELGKQLFETFLPLHRFAERWSKRGAK
jgi:DNA-binding HxlR family transcriptional regulator